MKSKEIVKKLEPWLARNRRPAWKPIVKDGDGPATASKYCGTPWIGLDAPWPDCGLCKKPLQFFLQIDLGGLPEELGQRFGTGLLQLFYCIRDECQGDVGWEPFADDLSRVRIVQTSGPGLKTEMDRGLATVQASDHAKRIVGWDWFLDLPHPQEHDDLGLACSYDFKAGTLRLECPELDFGLTNPMNDCEVEEIASSAAGDKLAGWPAWVQGAEYPSCPRCGRRMILVFQADSEDHALNPHLPGGCGHITQCPDHKEVVAFGWTTGR